MMEVWLQTLIYLEPALLVSNFSLTRDKLLSYRLSSVIVEFSSFSDGLYTLVDMEFVSHTSEGEVVDPWW
jgi:hypothetical protein